MAINWALKVACESSLVPGCLTYNPIYIVGGVLLSAFVLCLAAYYGDSVLCWARDKAHNSPGWFWSIALGVIAILWVFFQALILIVVFLGILSFISLIIGRKNK